MLTVVINSPRSAAIMWVLGVVNCLEWRGWKMGGFYSYYQGEMWAIDSCGACLAELSTNC